MVDRWLSGTTLVFGWSLLIVASALVGVAITLDSSVGRLLNGVGGVLWLVGAGVLVSAARRSHVDRASVVMLLTTVVVLSTLVSPRDLPAASAGFFVGGALVGLVARRSAVRLSVVGLLPALWLPTHLGVAVAKAAYRAAVDQPAALRGDPPPTAALVPLAMVLMALAGGVLAGRMTERARDRAGRERAGGSSA